MRPASVPCTKVSGTSATVFLSRSVGCVLFQLTEVSLIWAHSSGRRKHTTVCHVTTVVRWLTLTVDMLQTAASVLGSAERSVPELLSPSGHVATHRRCALLYLRSVKLFTAG